MTENEEIYYAETMIMSNKNTRTNLFFKVATNQKVNSQEILLQQLQQFLSNFLIEKEDCILSVSNSFLSLNFTNASFKQAIFEAISKTWQKITDNLQQHSPQQISFGFKVLASIVAVDVNNQCEPMVLSIGTGSKWIYNEELAMDGKTVHDCHAEIIARRAFLCLLYEQLKEIGNEMKHDELIIEPDDLGGYRLKNHLRLYLYISKPPCGGAQGRPLQGNETADQLRVKLPKEGGGYQVMSPFHIADYNSLKAGKQPTTFMTCSDKVLMWNWVGLQGALLSAYLAPIFLSGIIVSDNYEQQIIEHALFGRVDQQKLKLEIEKEKLSFNLSFTSPQTGYFKPEKYMQSNLAPSKSNFDVPISHNWYRSNTNKTENLTKNKEIKVELINSKTGKLYFNKNSFSRLSKWSFATQFQALVKNKQLEPKRFENKNDDNQKLFIIQRFKGTYFAAKQQQSSIGYMKAKFALTETLEKSGLGRWTKAPAHVDQFVVE